MYAYVKYLPKGHTPLSLPVTRDSAPAVRESVTVPEPAAGRTGS